ncbi:transposase family protein [Francisella philomiragia]|uniref:transposase family protein n=1 Tax=Francisella philomiragia TaxID=28110 RepID=UPI001908D262|nr:transposase family protein [Francisella philomiragia]MBK2297325.1 transposase family protein [Francisella philomiragia]
MLLSYSKLSEKPRIFRKLTGLKLPDFTKIISEISSSMDKEFSKLGRKPKITSHEDRVLLVLIYYRCYMTMEFLGYLLNLDESNVCRLLKRVELLLVKKIHIKKDRTLTGEKVEQLLIDATEQPIQRPKKAKRRKLSYSGKKKRHTQKVEISIDKNGRITNISNIFPGKVHDIKIRRNSDKLPCNIDKYCDSGYQGLQKESNNVKLPYKKPKGEKLTIEQKQYNKSISKIRIYVEHKIAQIKKFRIVGETYRNFGKKANLRFNLIAGIINLQQGF